MIELIFYGWILVAVMLFCLSAVSDFINDTLEYATRQVIVWIMRSHRELRMEDLMDEAPTLTKAQERALPFVFPFAVPGAIFIVLLAIMWATIKMLIRGV